MDMSCTVGLGAGGEGVDGRERGKRKREKISGREVFRKQQFTYEIMWQQTTLNIVLRVIYVMVRHAIHI